MLAVENACRSYNWKPKFEMHPLHLVEYDFCTLHHFTDREILLIDTSLGENSFALFIAE